MCQREFVDSLPHVKLTIADFKQTSVAGAHYSTYHAASHFADPDFYIPERWLESRDKRFESDNRAALAVFSLGPRNCIGRK